jgi:hypothetical protein
MTDLKDDLDRALRSVTFGEPPVQRAMRDGQRLRNRRRAAVLAGAVAIVAVAAGYPALARNAATPPPVTGRTVSPTPSHSEPGDPMITDNPGFDGPGAIAVGTIGRVVWNMDFYGIPDAGDETCYGAYLRSGDSGGPGMQHVPEVTSGCGPVGAASLVSYQAPDPVDFIFDTGSVSGGTTVYATALGAVAPDVTYLILDFTDGQQLKLIPVTYQGQRYVG